MALAKAKNLAAHPQWLKLLHYHRHGGSWRSDIDGGYFFLSPRGKWDSQAELESTLRAFLSGTDLTPPMDPGMEGAAMHPLCKFRARLRFFQAQLGLADSLLPPVDCSDYQRWRDGLDPVGATLIFASSYLNNPSSAFGHTFLRLNSRGDTADLSILNYGITYAASLPPHDGLAFAYKGIFGAYRGNYAMVPYFLSLQKYANLESRDMWEYDLLLSSGQREYLVEHVWELGAAWMRYFFFDENCSYNIITLLDAAEPDWKLSEGLSGTSVMPVETVKLLQRKGLLVQRRRRLSLLSAFQERAAPLRGKERTLLRRCLRPVSDASGWARDTAGVPPRAQARILDAALGYVQYRKRRADSASERNWGAWQRRLLLERSRLPEGSGPESASPGAEQGIPPPEASHAPQRAGLALGMAQYRPFLDLTYRFTYHDLNARESGFRTGTQIEAFKFAMRMECGRDCRDGVQSVGLHEAVLLAIQSLPPMDDLRQPMSWGFRIGYDTRPEASGRPGRAITGEGGIGASTDWTAQSGAACLPFFLLEAKARLFHAPEWKADAGPQTRMGVRMSLGQNASLLIENAEYAPAPFRTGVESDLRTELRLSLGKDAELRAAALYLNGAGEASLTWNGYF